MIKLLGLLDLVSGLALMAKLIGFPITLDIAVLFALYLLIKGSIFLFGFADIGSLLDIFCAIVLLSAFLIPTSFLIILISALFLALKGIFSLIF